MHPSLAAESMVALALFLAIAASSEAVTKLLAMMEALR